MMSTVFLRGKRYLIHDRDPLYTAESLATLLGAGVQSVKLPPQSLGMPQFLAGRDSIPDNLLLLDLGESPFLSARARQLQRRYESRKRLRRRASMQSRR